MQLNGSGICTQERRVAMYILDLVGNLDPSLDGVRCASVFRYYGRATVNGIEARVP